MNFSNFKQSSWLGKIIRFPLRVIPPDTIFPIVWGRLRGKKWITGSSIHGCWLGIYEYKKQMVFSKKVSKSNVVFDIGANVGFYTLLASCLTGSEGKVFAFEPLPENISFLREHLRINEISNVEIFDIAISNNSGFAIFDEGPHRSMGRLSNAGKIKVPTDSLDNLIELNHLQDPAIIKMDIEGGETEALKGAHNLLSRAHPIIFLATHGKEIHDECCNILKDLGYILTALDGRDLPNSREILAE